VRLAAELPVDADLPGHGGDLIGEHGEGVDHPVDGLGQLGDFTLRLEDQLPLQVTVRDRGHDLGDAAHLAGQVRGHRVHVVGEIFPRAADAAHEGLTTQLSFGADLARDAGDLGGEAIQLIDHDVDGVLQLEDLALHVDGDLPGKVPARDGGRDLGDVAH